MNLFIDITPSNYKYFPKLHDNRVKVLVDAFIGLNFGHFKVNTSDLNTLDKHFVELSKIFKNNNYKTNTAVVYINGHMTQGRIKSSCYLLLENSDGETSQLPLITIVTYIRQISERVILIIDSESDIDISKLDLDDNEFVSAICGVKLSWAGYVNILTYVLSKIKGDLIDFEQMTKEIVDFSQTVYHDSPNTVKIYLKGKEFKVTGIIKLRKIHYYLNDTLLMKHKLSLEPRL